MPLRIRAKGDDKRGIAVGTLGVGLTTNVHRKVVLDMLALKPYWGKPAVRNFREGDGNVGIIRSPVRAITLPGNYGDAPNATVFAHAKRRPLYWLTRAKPWTKSGS
jgi:hypothetical protein